MVQHTAYEKLTERDAIFRIIDLVPLVGSVGRIGCLGLVMDTIPYHLRETSDASKQLALLTEL